MATYTISGRVGNKDRWGTEVNDLVHIDIESNSYPSDDEVKNRMISFWRNYYEKGTEVTRVSIESVYQKK